MNITVNSTTVSTLATLFITILTGLEGFNWFQLFAPDTSMKVVASIGLAKLILNVWAGFTAKQPEAPKE